MSNIVRDCLVSGMLALLCLVLFLGFSHIQDGVHVVDPGSVIHDDQKVCIDGGGYFPNIMPGPSPFLVCGVIAGFDPKEETVPAPPEYPEGDHNLEGTNSVPGVDGSHGT